MKKYIDLTITLENQMNVYPGDNPFSLENRKSIKSDGYNDQTLHASMHVGTHIDAPNHMLENNVMVKDYALATLIGEGVVLQFLNTKFMELNEDIKKMDLKDKMVLIDTNHVALHYKEYPFLSEPLVDHFIDQGVKAVLLDTPSPDDMPYPIHKKLLSNHIPIVENVTNLNALKKHPNFRVFAIPLKINASGAYTRVFAEVEM